MSRWIARSHARQRFLIPPSAFFFAFFSFAAGFAGLAFAAGAEFSSELISSATPSSAIALFLPRIGVVVIAAHRPEAGLVLLRELHAGDPLRARPEVEAGGQAAHPRGVCDRAR